jgi:anti-sigma-K factor RskA
LIASAADLKRAEVAKGNVKEIAAVSGDIVWSDERQEGYMRLRGLPANDANKETYQLLIFEDGNLEPHPKDGGVFDVAADGEVVIPIDAKLRVREPKVFAITIEKPGGVVVSSREKIAVLAKSET